MRAYTFRDWLRDHEGQVLLRVRVGYWRELREWPVPGRVFRWEGWLPELWYYAKCRAWHRYNVVVARSLPPTWGDRDNLMLHACFAILGDVIEKERIFEHNCADGDPDDGQSWAWALREMRELWDWWTVRRPEREAEYWRRLHAWDDLHQRDRDAYTSAHPGWQETDNPHLVRHSLPETFVEPEDTKAAWRELRAFDDDARDAEDDAMLARLMKVRGYLWT